MSTNYNIVNLEELKQRCIALHDRLHPFGNYSLDGNLESQRTSPDAIDMLMFSTLGENDIFSKRDHGFQVFDWSSLGARVFNSLFKKVRTNRLVSAYKLTEFGCLYAKVVKAKLMLQIGEDLWESSNKTKTAEEFELNVTLWFNDVFDLGRIADACNTLMNFKENLITTVLCKDHALRVYSGSVMRGASNDADGGIERYLLSSYNAYLLYIRSKWLESKNAQVVKAA